MDHPDRDGTLADGRAHQLGPQVPSAAAGEPLTTLLERLGRGCGEGRALVLQDGQLVGLVSPSDISRALQHTSLGRTARPLQV